MGFNWCMLRCSATGDDLMAYSQTVSAQFGVYNPIWTRELGTRGRPGFLHAESCRGSHGTGNYSAETDTESGNKQFQTGNCCLEGWKVAYLVSEWGAKVLNGYLLPLVTTGGHKALGKELGAIHHHDREHSTFRVNYNEEHFLALSCQVTLQISHP